MEGLENALRRLAQDASAYSGVEEATRQAAILPVLANLGWDTFNVREVTPEHRVENRRVDYCLHVNRAGSVYIEVKRAGEDLVRHERQLLEYAFADGVPLAILTNGLHWWFYLPCERGKWSTRKFFVIDIGQQEFADAARHFERFLGKPAVSSGDAVAAAREVRASAERARAVAENLPVAWRELLEEPESPLLEVVRDRVESISGFVPDGGEVASFLNSLVRKSLVDPTDSARAGGSHDNCGATGTTGVSEKRQGARVKVGDRVLIVNSVPQMYREILAYLDETGDLQRLRPLLPYATSSRRYLMSDAPIHPAGNPFRVPVGLHGYFVEAHKSYDQAIAAMDAMLRQIGLSCTDVPVQSQTTEGSEGARLRS